MCWESRGYRTPIKTIADKDRYVFKICATVNLKQRGGKGFAATSYFFRHLKNEYEVGKTYTSVLDAPRKPSRNWEIHHGLHSYSPRCIAHPYSDITMMIAGINNNIIAHYCLRDICLVLCVIPKGTPFYVNEDGEYVSEELRVEHIMFYPKESQINAMTNKWQYGEIKNLYTDRKE